MENTSRKQKKILWKIFCKVIHINPWFCMLIFFLALLGVGESLSFLIFPTLLLEEITTAFRIEKIFLWGSLCICIPIIFSVLKTIISSILGNVAKYVEDELEISIDQVNMQECYANFDSPEIHTIFQEIKDGQNMVGPITGIFRDHILSILKNIVILIIYVPMVFRLGSTDWIVGTKENILVWICGNTPVFLLFILSLCCATMVLRYYWQQKAYRLVENFSDVEREYQYYVGIRSDYESGADIRLNDLGKMLSRRIEEYNRKERKMHLTVSAFQGKADFLLEIFKGIQILAIYGFVLGKVLNGAISIGGFYLYTNVLSQGLEAMAEILRQYGELRNSEKYYGGYLKLWEREKITEKEGKEIFLNASCGEITFDNISFRYPGTKRWVLKNINLTIRPGEKVAIVGRNGAGKTTFVKVLMGLYPIESGHIYINGQDINTLDNEKRFSVFSTVFQDYSLFAASIIDNVSMFEKTPDEAKVLHALKNAGFHINKKEDLFRQVSRHLSEEGILFSGGEEQKIAIARALYKDAPYYIMDEPSAALDPIAEREINERILKATEGRTLVIISHRLSACSMVDRVIVLEDGGIQEEGSHQELLEKKGLYAQMWEAQARYYR